MLYQPSITPRPHLSMDHVMSNLSLGRMHRMHADAADCYRCTVSCVVCWSQQFAVLKRLNGSRRGLRHGRQWLQAQIRINKLWLSLLFGIWCQQGHPLSSHKTCISHPYEATANCVAHVHLGHGCWTDVHDIFNTGKKYTIWYHHHHY